MNVGDERRKSYWMERSAIEARPLTADAECDVVVVGSGIAGLSCAYELSRHGRSVIVIDRGAIGSGMTARTTAHLATELDDRYFELIKSSGEDTARRYYQSQVAAIDRIEAICRDEHIDAHFRRIDGYLIPADESSPAELQDEFDACRQIGVEVEWADQAPMPGFDSGRCLRFPRQGRFHPTRYLEGLVRAIIANGGRLHGDTAHVRDEEKDGGVEVATEGGPVVRAGAAIFATNSPTNTRVTVHAKLEPNRTYAIAGRVPKGSVPDALVWDTLDAYHYVRIEELDDDQDLLIVGGEDHRSGEANDMEERLAKLAEWTQKRYPSFASPDYSWSGQVLEPIDFLPFSGRHPGAGNVYVHSGDSGQGITNGVAGSLTILPLILGRDSRFASIFDPGRKPASAIREFLRGQAGAVKNLLEHLGPGEIGSAEELEPGEGGIITRGLHKVAIYRAEDGKIVEHSASCTHLGCVVHWNSFEKCWDCPCHGSQFAPNGLVLNGPALQPLKEAER